MKIKELIYVTVLSITFTLGGVGGSKITVEAVKQNTTTNSASNADVSVSNRSDFNATVKNSDRSSSATLNKKANINPAKKATIKKVRQIDLIKDLSPVFDPVYYANRYPDVKAAFGNNEKALLKHFKEHGIKEGRVGKQTFDVKAYMFHNLDLVASFKADDLSEYYVHYMNHGQKEMRKAVFEQGNGYGEGVLGTFTTHYDVKEARAHNVELASSRMNGTIIEPGKTFSFSKTIGTRTVKNGYVNGPSFASGKEVESIGGGICQVSSNLYVSLLLSGIEPTEHHYHSLPVDYVPAKLDAAIAENYLDLQFKNETVHKIVIESIAKDGVLTVSLIKQ